MNKKGINYNSLNDVIGLSKRILKILYTCIILAIIFVSIVLLKETKVLGFIWSIIKIASPFFIGLIIAWLLDPIVSWLQKKNVKRIIGAIIVFCLFILFVYLLFRILIPMLYSQLNDFVETLPSLFLSISNWISGFFNRLGSTGIDFTSIEENVYQSITNLSTTLTTNLPKSALSVISTLVSGIGTFFIGLLVGFYLLIDFDRVRKLKDFVPKKYRKDLFTLGERLNQSLKQFIRGTLTISLIIMAVSTIGYGAIGLTTPLLFGLICGIANVIPYIGPWLSGAVCVVVGLTISPMVGILSGIIAFAIQQIDSIILQPVIMGKTMKLHPVTVMIGVLIFGYFFGILGMILATPVISGFKILSQYFLEKYHIVEKMKRHAETKEETKEKLN